MKIIKTFIASSSELKLERRELVDMFHEINENLEDKGIRFKPVLWEYMDSSMGIHRKEDEYLQKLRECELCIALFWRIKGEYTIEELEVAVSELRKGNLPKKVYVFYKDTKYGEISEELSNYKVVFAQSNPDIPVCLYRNIEELRNKIIVIAASIAENNMDNLVTH